MTDYKKYINALRKCAKEHENDITSFAHIRVSDLCQDTANLLETLEQGLVLDRIKDEIRHEQNMDCKCHRKTYDNCLRIIDKYKTDIKGEE